MTGPRGSLAYVSQWFAPEPVAVPVWVPRALGRRGWDVTVVTGVPNYPSGRVAEGYRAYRRYREQVDEFEVVRTPLYASHDGRAARRFANYASWAASSSLMARGALTSADVALVYSSPATAALPAMLARRRTPYVLMVQDVWPDSIFASGFLTEGRLRSSAERWVGRFADAAYRQAHAVAVISPGMKDLLVSRGVPASKVKVVYNWVDEKIFTPAEPEPGLREGLGISPTDFVLMYAGNHGAAQDLETTLEAFRLLVDAAHVHLVLVGDGFRKAALRDVAQRHGLDRVHFLDPRPTTDMTGVMAAAEAHLVSLADDPLFHITMPSKVQGVLAAGRPLLVSAPGDAGRVATDLGAGVSVPPARPDLLAAAVRQLASADRSSLRAMAERGRAAYLREMCEDVGASRLSDLLDSARRSREAA